MRVKTPSTLWEKGTITGTKIETQLYEVKTEAGTDYTKKNRKHLRKSDEGPEPYDNQGMSYNNPDMPYDNPDGTSNYIKGNCPESNTSKDPMAIITQNVK